jgi:hypothetical protein
MPDDRESNAPKPDSKPADPLKDLPISGDETVRVTGGTRPTRPQTGDPCDGGE